jgi:cell division protein ZapA (FtsZ GTPase activity inhibitor)
VAILTAINIADELFRLQKEKGDQEENNQNKINDWIETLGKTLEK